MSEVKDSFIDLERRRRQLESNVSELQKLLQHWQTWEAEYEGLKEEIESFEVDASPQRIQVVVDDFNGELVTSGEISKLVKDDNGAPRKASQIRNLLSRRIEYVQENVKSLQKRRDAAEMKLAGISVVMQPEARDEEGLPLAEITEELDDNDNIISSRLQMPGDSTPQIIEALRKHGVTDLPGLSAEEAMAVDKNPQMVTSKGGDAEDSSERTKLAHRSGSISTKKVTFAEPEILPPKHIIASSNPTESFMHLQKAHQDVVEGPADHTTRTDPVIPAGETPEEAKLRSEMLEYNLNNVGAIVAEINLDEPDSDDSFSDIEDEDTHNETDEDDEDQWGRTTLRVVSDNYRREMLELERKLNAKSMINAGPDYRDELTNPRSPRERKASVKDFATTTGPQASLRKKEVKFANRLDVQAAPVSEMAKTLSKKDGGVSPLAKAVVEETEPNNSVIITPGKRKDAFSFNPARIEPDQASIRGKSNPLLSNGPLAGMESGLLKPISGKSRKTVLEDPSRLPVSEAPAGPTILENLVEQSPPLDRLEELDDLDPQLMKQQAAVQYHEMRNRMIQRNGGFMEPDESGPDPDRPKVSRFKATRMTKVVR